MTGGIASGKSIASDELRYLGVPVIDYDVLARQAIAPGSIGAALVASTFGTLDRAALAREVFFSEDARLRLESIVHPLVFEAAAIEDARVLAPLVVHEIPLLAEVMTPAGFDQVIVVDAPAELRLRRLVEGRGMDPVEAARRIAAQASDEQRRAIADIIWDGSGTPENLRAQVRAWLN